MVLEEQNTSLYLDINQKEIIQGFYFETKQVDWIPGLSKIAEICQGLSLEQSLLINPQMLGECSSNQDVFPVPFLLFRDLLQDFKGQPPTHCQAVSEKPENLVCRCFGVYQREIRAALMAKEDAKIIDVTNLTRAGGGCTSCLEDIALILKELRYETGFGSSESFFDENGKYRRYGEFTPAEFLIELDKGIKYWIVEQKREHYIEICQLEGHQLRLKTDLGWEGFESLQKYLRMKYDQPLFLLPS
ncbi:MAG: hypothetical protein HN509_17250 [Halobacteriovoraceae bacterium]|nr:hypothetical protein [Halobacteriovoraceae bacterium]